MDDPLNPGELSINDLAAASLRARGKLRVRVTGSSMLPAICPDDVLFIRHCPIDAARNGDIVAFIRHGRLFVHRVTALRGHSVVTQGDANTEADPEVHGSEFLGKVNRLVRRGKATRASSTRTFAGRAAAALFRRWPITRRLFMRIRRPARL